ncbi:MAG: type III pantothenate kinase [Pirellulales bacterium]|nr:type III pantothenate kinase [Pirellulales bacterium]
MSPSAESGLVAIDVGSSRIKLGWFPPPTACTSEGLTDGLPITTLRLPQPEATLALTHRKADPGDLIAKMDQWLEPFSWKSARRLLASVFPDVNPLVAELLQDRPRQITAGDLPLQVRVDQPDKVGIDRLLIAVVANRLREPHRGAIAISLGTVTTVNRIGVEGAFEGGAILPGLAMSSAALHAGTSSLPYVRADSAARPPAAVGMSTSGAIAGGLYWGAVGAIRTVAELQTRPDEPPPHVFVTGGDAPLLADQLEIAGAPVCHVPHMVLVGMAIAAASVS